MNSYHFLKHTAKAEMNSSICFVEKSGMNMEKEEQEKEQYNKYRRHQSRNGWNKVNNAPWPGILMFQYQGLFLKLFVFWKTNLTIQFNVVCQFDWNYLALTMWLAILELTYFYFFREDCFKLCQHSKFNCLSKLQYACSSQCETSLKCIKFFLHCKKLQTFGANLS